MILQKVINLFNELVEKEKFFFTGYFKDEIFLISLILLDESSNQDDKYERSPSTEDASALREFQARILATQPQMAAPQMGRRGSGGRRHTLCLSR